MELADRIIIDCPPGKVYNKIVFFFQNSDHYKTWHKDHISCYWKKGMDFSPGSILIACEYLHGIAFKLPFRIINNKPDSRLDYKLLFPFSLVCPGGSFQFIRKGTATEFVAKLNLRPGSILQILFKRHVDSLKRHIKEEGISLKEITEKI